LETKYPQLIEIAKKTAIATANSTIPKIQTHKIEIIQVKTPSEIDTSSPMQDVVNEDDFLSNFLANDSLENTYFNPDVLNNIFPSRSITNKHQSISIKR